jgi:hypothetical protein
VPFAEPGLVLAKCHVQDPVTAILDAPMATDRAGERLHVY